MARSEGLEPTTPWFEALSTTFKFVKNQQLPMRQISEKRSGTA